MWRIPLLVTSAASTVLLGLFLYSPYGDEFYIFVVAPAICLVLLSVLLAAAISREVRPVFTILLTLAGVVVVSWLLLKNEVLLRSELRWLFRSGHYKSEVLAIPRTSNGLRHLEWDSWGFVPVGNNFVYLVYDPSDRLAAAVGTNEPSSVSGIPCEVLAIHRLERQWYFVRFYTDQQWEDCGSAR